MSVSDSNKLNLASSCIISLLYRVLQSFANNEEPVQAPKDSIGTCGGGGSDIASAELAVETLLQLSFLYSNEGELRQVFIPTQDSDIVVILQGKK